MIVVDDEVVAFLAAELIEEFLINAASDTAIPIFIIILSTFCVGENWSSFVAFKFVLNGPNVVIVLLSDYEDLKLQVCLGGVKGSDHLLNKVL